MSAVLKTLHARGLIDRSRSQDDQRLVNVTITSGGHREIEQLYRAHHERERSWLQALDTPEKEAMANGLRKLLRHHPPSTRRSDTGPPTTEAKA